MSSRYSIMPETLWHDREVRGYELKFLDPGTGTESECSVTAVKPSQSCFVPQQSLQLESSQPTGHFIIDEALGTSLRLLCDCCLGLQVSKALSTSLTDIDVEKESLCVHKMCTEKHMCPVTKIRSVATER